MSHYRHRVVPSDRNAVRALLEATGLFLPAEVDLAEHRVGEHLSRNDASGYRFLFVEREGRLVASACYGPIALTEGSWTLYNIAAHPDEQGQGTDAALLAEVERRIAAQHARQIYVETSSLPRDPSAQAFYAQGGYTHEATLKDFYSPGHDKLILVRRL